jgi:hypothetical protein
MVALAAASMLVVSCGGGGKDKDVAGGNDQLTTDQAGDVQVPEDQVPGDTPVPPDDSVTPPDADVIGDSTVAPDETPADTGKDAVEPEDTPVTPDVEKDTAEEDTGLDTAEDVPVEDTELPANAVGPDGGEVSGPDGIKLIIPAGALDKVVEFSLAKVDNPHAGTFTTLSAAFDIGPSGTQFLKDAKLEIPVDALPGGGTPLVYTAQGKDKAWTALPTEINGMTLVATVKHLSWFQAGFEGKTDVELLCDFLIPCMVDKCGLVEPGLSEAKAECPTLFETELTPEQIAPLLATEDCNGLLKGLAQYNLELVDVCDIQTGPCDESVPYVVGCMVSDCPNSASFKVGMEQLFGYQCSQAPDVFGTYTVMTCPQIVKYFSENMSQINTMCTTGPAVPAADCAKLLNMFSTCTAPPGSKYGMMTPEVIGYYMCGLGMMGAGPVACGLAAIPDCTAFYACFPE